MDYNIPEVSVDALLTFRKLTPDLIKEVVKRSMERKDEVFHHGDKQLEILTYGIDMTTKMLDNAMAIHEPALLDEQLKWAIVRLPIDGVKPEHIYNRFQIYIDVVDELMPVNYAKEVNNFVSWMLKRQKELMDEAGKNE